ncbi:MAG: ATP-binding protein [Phycisphaerales bacterium]
MIDRLAAQQVRRALARQPAVAVLGPRQVGKTTLAIRIAGEHSSVYLDLQAEGDRAKLAEPAAYLRMHSDKLVVLDEVHRVPELFPTLRGLIDEGRREGKRRAKFLILGSASLSLLQQSSESLAGRIGYVELGPIQSEEVTGGVRAAKWLRGGFPESLLAADDASSLAWRRDFIRTYLERDLPSFGPRIPAETLGRLWTMLAHHQAGLMNASELARGLTISPQTVSRYVDLLSDLMLVRRLPPYAVNVGKRLVKSPKVYIRDSGMLHALLGIRSTEDLLGHPIVGASWEGMVMEELIAASPEGAKFSFYRTAQGAEIDLVIELPGPRLWAVEIKRSSAPKLEKGFHLAREDLNPERTFVVYGGVERFPLANGAEAIGGVELCGLLRAEGAEA